MKFSVLMSCHIKDNPMYLEAALKSLLSQSVLPSEIILIEDGELSDLHDQVLNDYEIKLAIKRFKFKKNNGLGFALNFGVNQCSYDYIARMDTDDICEPDRFETQINLFKEYPSIDLIGSWIGEFKNDPNEVFAIRKVPTSHLNIVEFAKTRNPFNHMTVFFKKEAVLKAGNYDPKYVFAQDYLLWANMIALGCRFANLPRVLVKARAGKDMFKRRGGLRYLRFEYHLQKKLKDLGLIDTKLQCRNLLIRGIVRLVPNGFREFIYKNILRK
jgi:glycosyltransferase involved in cell wall biosynthesis